MDKYTVGGGQIRGHKAWIGALLIFTIVLLLRIGAPALAAPSGSTLHQTVPLPTATPDSEPIPTATPASASNTDDEEENSSGDEGNSEDSESAENTTPDEDVEYGVEFAEPTPTPVGGANRANTTTEATAGENSTGASNTPGQRASGPTYTGAATVLLLNLREEPDPDAAIVGTVFQDDPLEILGRNESGSWLLICCTFGREVSGWVNAEFIELLEIEAAQANELIPVIGGVSSAASTTDTAATAGVSSLQLEIRNEPSFVWQEQQVEITFVVTNAGSTEAIGVELRDDLAPELQLIDMTVEGDGVLEQTASRQGGTILTAFWPQLAPGEEAFVHVTLQVDAEIPNGAVIDNLAVVNADNAEGMTAGIRIGMPPNTPPDFR